MPSGNFSSLENAQNKLFGASEDAIAFSRFLIWAFEEADVTLDDEFIKAAIATIIQYMEKHYGTGQPKAH